MPAYRERIYICPGEKNQPIKILDFPLWWDRRSFFSKFGHRQIDTGNPFYVDYGLLLAVSEAIAWDKECRKAFGYSHGYSEPHIAGAMDSLEAALRGASWVIVESSEWESGLD